MPTGRLQNEILFAFSVPTVLFRDLELQGPDLAEQDAQVYAQLLGRGRAVSSVSPQGVRDMDRLQFPQRSILNYLLFHTCKVSLDSLEKAKEALQWSCLGASKHYCSRICIESFCKGAGGGSGCAPRRGEEEGARQGRFSGIVRRRYRHGAQGFPLPGGNDDKTGGCPGTSGRGGTGQGSVSNRAG